MKERALLSRPFRLSMRSVVVGTSLGFLACSAGAAAPSDESLVADPADAGTSDTDAAAGVADANDLPDSDSSAPADEGGSAIEDAGPSSVIYVNIDGADYAFVGEAAAFYSSYVGPYGVRAWDTTGGRLRALTIRVSKYNPGVGDGGSPTRTLPTAGTYPCGNATTALQSSTFLFEEADDHYTEPYGASDCYVALSEITVDAIIVGSFAATMNRGPSKPPVKLKGSFQMKHWEWP